ncbi:MAG TPA: lytic transglycosylase domain-containing protein [Rhodocyclaceae bacterium]|nr:lytic transglycosylase domain-containing protein [Rhodocyclaceae bacterium]
MASPPSCWERASARYHVDPTELVAHACVESHLRTDAIHVNANGTEDLSVMQINSGNLPRLARYGITRSALTGDPCLNIHVGAYILAEQKARYGDTWEATGAYNAACTKLKSNECKQVRAAYAWRVYRAMRNLHTTGHC